MTFPITVHAACFTEGFSGYFTYHKRMKGFIPLEKQVH